MAATGSRTIQRLATAVMSVARQTAGVWLFAGWDEAGLPMATDRLADLSAQAREELTVYQNAGLRPRRVPYVSLEAFEYVLTGPAIDFSDVGPQRAEDQVRYTVLDSSGERRELVLGEMAVLGAIRDAQAPWQVPARTSLTAVADSTLNLYTLIVPAPGQPADRGLALLFRPTVAAAGNEAAFASFVRGTISRLLILDESQPPGKRKGYLEVAGRLAGRPPSGGLAATLLFLRRLGLISFSDEWFRQLRYRQQVSKAALIRLLRALGLVDLSDEALQELAHPRPDYNVEPLELDGLLALAGGMYDVVAANRPLASSVATPTDSRPRR